MGSVLKGELINSIEKYSNSLAPSPDKLTWSHIKNIIKNKECIIKFIDIANVCINLGYWLSHFKTSMTVVIPKPNKVIYNSPKSFCLIIFLNTIGKLFEKIIEEQLQFLTISNNFIHIRQSQAKVNYECRYYSYTFHSIKIGQESLYQHASIQYLSVLPIAQSSTSSSHHG